MIRLPGKFGEAVVLPRVRYAYSRLPFLDWRNKRYARSEARRIRSAISANFDKFTIVIDCEIIGLTYGGIFYMLAVARYIISQGGFVRLCVVDTVFPLLLGGTDQDETEYFVSNIIDIAETLLDSKLSSVQLISLETLPSVVDTPKNEFLLFEDFVRDRRPIHNDCFNVFNCLMADATSSVQVHSLFSSHDFQERFPRSFSLFPYVSWHCRYCLKGSNAARQTMPDEFLQSYKYLRSRFPNHDILIVSDSLGCQHYSSLADDLEIDDLLFSKDYSPDLIGDAALILSSDFFYWYRAGGIGTVPLLSRMPYEMVGPIKHETMWNRRKLTSWQEDSQKFTILDSHEIVDDRSLDIDKIGAF